MDRYLAELQRRTRLAEFTPASLCFPKQRSFVEDETRAITAVCSRQAGKTKGSAIKLLLRALRYPGTLHGYVTQARTNAKDLIWPDLLAINEQFGLGGETNLTDLEIRFPNGSRIKLFGAKDAADIRRLRGYRFKTVVVDEAQNFASADLADLLDNVLPFALAAFKGQLVIIGTPPPVCFGTFYDRCRSPEWAHHHWKILDNTFIDGAGELERIRREQGIDETHPRYRREALGEFVEDLDSLCFRWSPANDWDGVTLPGGNMRYVMAVDLGYEDPDAINVWGWSDESPDVLSVFEYRENHLTPSQLHDVIRPSWERYGRCRILMDELGGGKRTAEQFRREFRIPAEPARSFEKGTCITFLDDGLRTGRVKVRRGSKLHEEFMLTQWKPESMKRGKLEVDDRHYHPNLAMAAAYGYREARHYTYKAPPPPKSEKELRLEREAARWKAERERPWFLPGGGDGNPWGR